MRNFKDNLFDIGYSCHCEDKFTKLWEHALGLDAYFVTRVLVGMNQSIKVIGENLVSSRPKPTRYETYTESLYTNSNYRTLASGLILYSLHWFWSDQVKLLKSLFLASWKFPTILKIKGVPPKGWRTPKCVNYILKKVCVHF